MFIMLLAGTDFCDDRAHIYVKANAQIYGLCVQPQNEGLLLLLNIKEGEPMIIAVLGYKI